MWHDWPPPLLLVCSYEKKEIQVIFWGGRKRLWGKQNYEENFLFTLCTGIYTKITIMVQQIVYNNALWFTSFKGTWGSEKAKEPIFM